MKTFEEVIEEYVSESGFDFRNLKPQFQPEYWGKAAKRYATEAIKEHLERAAENATGEIENNYSDLQPYVEIDKQSITEIEIILK